MCDIWLNSIHFRSRVGKDPRKIWWPCFSNKFPAGADDNQTHKTPPHILFVLIVAFPVVVIVRCSQLSVTHQLGSTTPAFLLIIRYSTNTCCLSFLTTCLSWYPGVVLSFLSCVSVYWIRVTQLFVPSLIISNLFDQNIPLLNSHF